MSISLPTYTRREMPLLAPMLSMIAVCPLVLTPLVAALLGSFSWTIALEAIGLSFLIGSLFTAFYTAATLALSSLTRRKSYAAAGVFALTFGLTIPAEILAGPPLNNPAVLYASPWENYLAVDLAAPGRESVEQRPGEEAPRLLPRAQHALRLAHRAAVRGSPPATRRDAAFAGRKGRGRRPEARRSLERGAASHPDL